MGKVSRSDTGLMLVQNPKETLKALCSFVDTEVDWPSYKLNYERVIGRLENPVAKGHADTHFYTLTIYNLLTPTSQKGKYRLSLIAKELCALLNDSNKKDEYRQLLSNLILTNEQKGELFRSFLCFIREKKSIEEINQKFKPLTVRTLIAWTKEAGLIQKYQNYFRAIPRLEEKPKLDQFKNILEDTYNELETSGIFGIRRIYVPMGELRLNVCAKLGLKKEEFYENFKRLLATEYGKRINFYGAPSHIYETEETFEYNGKLYVYLSIEV